jgi:hypothetical protein
VEQELAEAPPSHRFIHREPAEPQDGKRVTRQFFPSRRGEVFHLEMSGRHRCVPDDPVCLHGDVGCADMVTELILAGVLVKETVKILVAGSKPGPFVRFPERPNLHRPSGGHVDAWLVAVAW